MIRETLFYANYKFTILNIIRKFYNVNINTGNDL